MVRQFKNGAKIRHQYDEQGTQYVDFTDNISCFSFTGKDANWLKSYLAEVVNVNENVKKLDSYALNGCEKLKKVELPSTLTSLGEECMSDCGQLSAVFFTDKLDSLPKGCFKNDSNLVFAGLSGYEACMVPQST